MRKSSPDLKRCGVSKDGVTVLVVQGYVGMPASESYGASLACSVESIALRRLGIPDA